MSLATTARKPIGVLATPEQHRLLTEAATREHRSVSGFVLQAALAAAQTSPPKPKRSREEVMAIVKAAQQAVREANPENRDILEEFLADRRAEAARE